MDITAILRQIDAELDRLESIRGIVSSLGEGSSQGNRRRRTQRPAPAELPSLAVEPETAPEPRLVIVPAKIKREYGPRPRRKAIVPTALTAPASERPLFVPKPRASDAPVAKPEPMPIPDTEAMEAALRRNLLGGVA